MFRIGKTFHLPTGVAHLGLCEVLGKLMVEPKDDGWCNISDVLIKNKLLKLGEE